MAEEDSRLRSIDAADADLRPVETFNVESPFVYAEESAASTRPASPCAP
jgi:hypothetical protein